MLMLSPITVGGKDYISAVRASERGGYTSDYIGQLCRAGRIPGKLIGKTWFIDYDALVEHKKNRRIRKSTNKTFTHIPLNKGAINYESEVLPLFPVLTKKIDPPTNLKKILSYFSDT